MQYPKSKLPDFLERPESEIVAKFGVMFERRSKAPERVGDQQAAFKNHK